MSFTHDLTHSLPTSAGRTTATATLAVLAALVILVAAFGFSTRSVAASHTTGAAARTTLAAGEHQIAKLRHIGFLEAACTARGTLLINRHTNQTRIVKI
jgi:hypothetical protein